MSRASRFVLNINYHQLSINYFHSSFSLTISLMLIHAIHHFVSPCSKELFGCMVSPTMKIISLYSFCT